MEKISLNLSSMKFMLYGDAENEPKEADVGRLVDELFASNLLLDLLAHMKEFEFEARKDVARVYDFVLRQRKAQSLDYVKAHPDILRTLVEGYTDSEIALNCGSILREVIRHEELNDLALNSPLFDRFFDFVQLSTFDIASDAFATFKLMLTKHKVLSAKFLDTHYDEFVQRYNVLLQSRNYVTKRQSLKLLGELLLNRSNFSVMMRYINSADNLKIMMNLLRGNTRAIQFEAFHVFKIFVANPKKSPAVVDILVRNKRKLIEFLQKFQKEKVAHAHAWTHGTHCLRRCASNLTSLLCAALCCAVPLTGGRPVQRGEEYAADNAQRTAGPAAGSGAGRGGREEGGVSGVRRRRREVRRAETRAGEAGISAGAFPIRRSLAAVATAVAAVLDAILLVVLSTLMYIRYSTSNAAGGAR